MCASDSRSAACPVRDPLQETCRVHGVAGVRAPHGTGTSLGIGMGHGIGRGDVAATVIATTCARRDQDVVTVDLVLLVDGLLVGELLGQSFPLQQEGLSLTPSRVQVTLGSTRGQPAGERAEQHAQPEHRCGSDHDPVQEQLPHGQAGQMQTRDSEVRAQRVAPAVGGDAAHRGQRRESQDQQPQDGDQCQHLRELTGVSPSVSLARSGRWHPGRAALPHYCGASSERLAASRVKV